MLIGVMGTGRNGSSLILRLLDGLGNTYVHPVEERFLTAFDSLSRRGKVTRLVQQNCIRHRLCALDGELDVDVLTSYYDRVSLSELNRALEAHTPGLSITQLLAEDRFGPERFVHTYLREIARAVRPDLEFRHYLFKSIETPYVEEYEARFPDMRFVHLIRDPVQVCSSQKRSMMMNKRLPASYLGYDWLSCMLDMRWVPHARIIERRQDNPNHVLVRYEDLVRRPGTEIRRIAKALDLAPPEQPEKQTIFYNQERKSWGFNPSKKGVRTPQSVVPNLQSRYQYEAVLTERELDLIGVKTRGLLASLGYEPPTEATRADVVVKYLLPDEWEWMHWRSPAHAVRGMIGMVYRRIAIF